MLISFAATNLNFVYFKGQNCEEYNRINALSVFVEKEEQEKQQEILLEYVVKPKSKLTATKWVQENPTYLKRKYT